MSLQTTGTCAACRFEGSLSRANLDAVLLSFRESIFQGSVWEYDEPTEEYYLHLFLKEQPDLNWECQELREAVYEMVRWWLDKGIDGFRYVV